MAKRSTAVAVPAEVAVGAAVGTDDLINMSMSITGTFTATYKVEVSYDGTNYVQHGADVTAAADRTLPDAAKKVRVNCTAYTSGTPAGGLAGLKG